MDLAERAEHAVAAALDAFTASQPDAVVAHLSTAVREFTEAGDPRRASFACVLLGQAMSDLLGNLVAGRVWFDRAWRLVADLPDCVEQGWALLGPIGCDVGDPVVLAERADRALELARRLGDIDLEAKALADGGLARVQLGRHAEGLALLDEALALICGPGRDPMSASRAVCAFFTACYYSAEFDRAEAWVDPLRRKGVIGTRTGFQIWLSNHCDAVRAYSLIELGRWAEAEAVLLAAQELWSRSNGGDSWHAALVLADLRILQGRLEDAERLLLGRDAAFEALLPTARLHLARGDHGLAQAAARRGLKLLGSDLLRAVELLGVLVGAALASGDRATAQAAAAELAARAAGVASATVRARCALVRAEAAAALGDPRVAVALLDTAIGELGGSGAAWLRVRLLCATARHAEAAGDRAAAGVAAAAAQALMRPLDVVLAEPDADVLVRLTERSWGRPVGGAQTAVLWRQGKWWEAEHAGRRVRLPASKGLAYVAELVSRPGVERHALDLADRFGGDAGPRVDGAARRAYRTRIEELREVAADALASGDFALAERAQIETDQLVGELARAFGLGGRERRAASVAERARLNVTRAVRAATARLGEALPEAGCLLDARVRTGTFCAYEPQPDDPVRWTVG